jgi:hypothetical protein
LLRTAGAAAHVAGAAALALGANPDLDVSVLQGFLEDQASPMSQAGADLTGIDLTGHGALNIEGGASAPLDSSKEPQAPAGDGFTPLGVPQRILDTLTSTGGHLGKLTADETFTLPLPSTLPTDVDAVAVSITGFNGTKPTDLRASAETAVYGTSSTDNVGVGENKYVGTIVRVGHDRAIRIHNTAGEINVAVDLFGYFNPDGASTYVPRQIPTRIMDTGINVGGNFSASSGKLAASTTPITVPLLGAGSVDPEIPATATAVVLNVGMLGASSSDADVRVYPQDYDGTGTCHEPVTKVRECMVIVGIGSDGKIRVRNGGPGAARVVLDLAGWFVSGGGGQRYVPLHDQTRVVDTRSGTGRLGRFRGSADLGVQSASFGLAGLHGVPRGPVTTAVDFVGVQPSAHSWFGVSDSAFPGPENEYTIGMETGETNANGALVPLSTADSRAAFSYTTNSSLSADVNAVMDVMGYFTPGPGGPLPTNAALNKPVTGPSPCTSTQVPAAAVNGTWGHGTSEKWCSRTIGATLMVDLGSSRDITSVLLFHAGAGGDSTALNTRDYDVQVSDDNVTYTTVVQQRGNTANITSHTLSTTARYVRLKIITPTQTTDTATRIYEMEVLATP